MLYGFARISQTMTAIKFQQLCSSVDTTFWQQFALKKIDELKLSEDEIPITAKFTTGMCHKSISLPPKIFLDNTAFDKNASIAKYYFTMPGILRNCNKLSDFRLLLNKNTMNKILKECGDEILRDIKNGSIKHSPNRLQRFIMLSYADLKKHKYSFWLGFPAIVSKDLSIHYKKIIPFMDYFEPENQEILVRNIFNFYEETENDALFNAYEQTIFIVLKKDFSILTLAHFLDVFLPSMNNNIIQEDILIGYVDNGCLSQYPSWNLRNILVFIQLTFSKILDVNDLSILCLRSMTKNCLDSIIFEGICMKNFPSNIANESSFYFTGWEKDGNNCFKPKQSNLSQYLNNAQMAEQSVNLNLKLMRWRRVPWLDLEKIAECKCLLLGAGTLGCYVARSLLAWGVKNITFVDNGRVSFSNPVRQPLYIFDDCTIANGGAFKAEAAPIRMKQIFANINCEGHILTIPMPGHFVSDAEIEETHKQYNMLCELIASHDAIFLLTDSRESRWLPTVLGAIHHKIVINAALGFDSYLVMRHGTIIDQSNNNSEQKSELSENLGCYFCTDIVGPRDSLRDRSLDEQCTVTRPGLAPIASAIATEMLVCLLNRNAQKEHGSNGKKLFDVIPHQIRGYLFDYRTMLLRVERFDKCPGCSFKIREMLRNEGFSFVLKVLNTPTYLETVSGLADILNVDILDDCEWSDTESEEVEKEVSKDTAVEVEVIPPALANNSTQS